MCNFKFKFDLPPPLPGLKLFFYPLEPDRYYKPKVTHYDATKAPDILADTNMGVPFEEMIINPYRYETVKSAESEQAKHNLAFLDYVFGEYVKADERPQPPKLEEVEPQTKVVQPRPEPERPVQARPRQVERPEEMTAEKFTSLLKKRVRETFEKKITIKEGDAHPKKSGVTCKKVYGISPNFSLLSHEMTYIRLERQFEESPSDKLALRLEQHSENTSKYVGLFRNDATITPESYIGPKDDEEAMKHEGGDVFKKLGQFNYEQRKWKWKIDESKEWLFLLNPETRKAEFLEVPSNLVLKNRIKKFPAIKQSEDGTNNEEQREQDEYLRIFKRKYFKSEAARRKQLRKELYIDPSSVPKSPVDNRPDDEDEIKELHFSVNIRKEEEPEQEEGHSMKDEDDGLRSDEGKSEAEGEAEVEPEARERNEESDEENYFESDDDEPAPAKAAAKEQDEQEAEEEDQPRQRKGRLRRGHDSENEED
eukprot:TRINITY_DN2851_c0_g1_i3.p1 TRINITY_DN2851_c0_g1~~TRINITY_DN2851_c0_g1_i3.p1  ORF type:complete len:480 (-),score=158.62 TRINITY_DN2851_c0_g1_i3:78-1517(-)